jgi:Arc/MetJ family transcription regulator
MAACISVILEIRRRIVMAVRTSIRLDARLIDEAARILGAKSRTDAVHMALREIVGVARFKKLLKKNAGKLKFAALADNADC